jgi:hypothetical protein
LEHKRSDRVLVHFPTPVPNQSPDGDNCSADPPTWQAAPVGLTPLRRIPLNRPDRTRRKELQIAGRFSPSFDRPVRIHLRMERS